MRHACFCIRPPSERDPGKLPVTVLPARSSGRLPAAEWHGEPASSRHVLLAGLMRPARGLALSGFLKGPSCPCSLAGAWPTRSLRCDAGTEERHGRCCGVPGAGALRLFRYDRFCCGQEGKQAKMANEARWIRLSAEICWAGYPVCSSVQLGGRKDLSQTFPEIPG